MRKYQRVHLFFILLLLQLNRQLGKFIQPVNGGRIIRFSTSLNEILYSFQLIFKSFVNFTHFFKYFSHFSEHNSFLKKLFLLIIVAFLYRYTFSLLNFLFKILFILLEFFLQFLLVLSNILYTFLNLILVILVILNNIISIFLHEIFCE